MLQYFPVCSVCYRVLQHVPTKNCISRCQNGCYLRSPSDLTVLYSALQYLAVFFSAVCFDVMQCVAVLQQISRERISKCDWGCSPRL